MSVVNELRSCKVIPACLAVLPKEVTVRRNCFYAIPLVRLGLKAQSLYHCIYKEERRSELENEKMCENEVVCGCFEGMENVDRLCS